MCSIIVQLINKSSETLYYHGADSQHSISLFYYFILWYELFCFLFPETAVWEKMCLLWCWPVWWPSWGSYCCSRAFSGTSGSSSSAWSLLAASTLYWRYCSSGFQKWNGFNLIIYLFDIDLVFCYTCLKLDGECMISLILVHIAQPKPKTATFILYVLINPPGCGCSHWTPSGFCLVLYHW